MVSDFDNLTKELHQKLPLFSIRETNNCHCIFNYILLYFILLSIFYITFNLSIILHFTLLSLQTSLLANTWRTHKIVRLREILWREELATQYCSDWLSLWGFCLNLFENVFYPTHPLPMQFCRFLLEFIRKRFYNRQHRSET